MGTVSRNDRFHEVPVEILQCVEWRRSQTARAWSQLRPDKGQPDIANHSHSGAESCGWAARMLVKKVLYILLYETGKLFDCNRDHI